MSLTNAAHGTPDGVSSCYCTSAYKHGTPDGVRTPRFAHGSINMELLTEFAVVIAPAPIKMEPLTGFALPLCARVYRYGTPHGNSRSPFNSTSLGCGLTRTRRSSCGPHTAK
jgi:hypothetical protein